jgi:hypothetical protein
VTQSQRSGQAQRQAEPDAAKLFELIWASLCEVIGSAATAALVRRSVRRASVRFPALAGFSIAREGFEYQYATPEGWSDSSRAGECLEELRGVIDALWPLLIELTGQVLVRRLQAIPEFQRGGLVKPEIGT